MSARIPTAPPDVLAALLPIVQSGLNSGEKAAHVLSEADKRAVVVRADLQGHATPISRYCRVGLTAFYQDSSGNWRLDEAFAMSNRAAAAILRSSSPLILAAEWQSGPFEVTDVIKDKPVAYSTLLLEVASTLL